MSSASMYLAEPEYEIFIYGNNSTVVSWIKEKKLST